jgi:hypothetical protein
VDSHRRSRRWLLCALAGLLLAVSLLLGAAARDALVAADEVERARAVLNGLEDAPGGSSGARGDDGRPALLDRLDTADRLLSSASRRLDRPAPRAVAALPLVGRSWQAERRVVEAAGAVVDGTRAAAEAAPGVRGPDGLDTGALRRVGDVLRVEAERAERALEALRTTPTGLTPPQVRSAVRDAVDALTPAVQGLRAGAEGARLGAGLLGGDGPRTMLVALGNNAELRGTGGYVSTFALGRLEDGTLTLEPFRDIVDVHEPREAARPVSAPPEYVEDYGPYLAASTDWRMWTMTPEVPVAAEVGAEITGALLGERADVVLFLDVPAVAALVELSGRPLVLPGGEAVPSEEVVEALLVDAYAQAGTDEQEQDARRAALRAAAGEAAASLLDTDLDLVDAGRELARLARGRHLALWSARPEEQRSLEELGLAGAIPAAEPGGADDLLLVTVNNLTANKLDYWVDRSVRHEARVHADRVEVAQTVRMDSRAPEALVPYVDGITTPGRSSLRVEFSIPPEATVHTLTVNGRPASGDDRSGAERTRVFTFVSLTKGEDVEVAVSYSLPTTDGRYRLRLVPQALARDAELSVRVSPGDAGSIPAGAGFEPDGRSAVRQGPWAEQQSVRLDLDRGGTWQRARDAVRDFWNEPVSLG